MPAIQAAILIAALAAAAAAPAALSTGNAQGSAGVTWGASVGGDCRDVVRRMRGNWMEVRRVVAPKAAGVAPSRRDFYCISPDYTREARQKFTSTPAGLRCYDVGGRGFCCDSKLRQCATL